MRPFRIPDGMHGRFAVVKLWPAVKVAEDEVIARLKVAGAELGLECVEILADGRSAAPPHLPVTRRDVDFAIHLHFDTPKAYDLFSFVALWNPARIIQNYAPGEFARLSRHLATHDDFLSCGSAAADDHIRRTLLPDPTRDGPGFRLYHSLAGPILEPRLTDPKLAYVGINWERLNGGKSRHQEVLDLLDATGQIRIYGPLALLGVRVWDGYRSYAGPLPFDGVSVVHALHEAGVGLVFGSAAHHEAGLMSCRLFETIAAGAVVICDEHPFAREHFGDTLLYVDTTGTAEDTFQQIVTHLRWVREHPAEAVALAKRAQAVFLDRFALGLSLRALYEGFPARKHELDVRQAPPEELPATLFLLLPEFDRAALRRHIDSVQAQEYEAVDYVLLVDERWHAAHAGEIAEMLRTSRRKIECRPTAFSVPARKPRPIPVGRVLDAAVADLPDGRLFGFVGPRERLTANHLRSLAGCLARRPDADCAYADSTLQNPTHGPDGSPGLAFQGEVDLSGWDPHRPLGFGRFLFRKAASTARGRLALPYLHHKAPAALVGPAGCVASRRMTVLALLPDGTTPPPAAPDIGMEDEILAPCLPDAEALRKLAARPHAASPAATVPAVVAPAPPPPPSAPAGRPPGVIRRAYRAAPLPPFVRAACRKLFHALRRLV